MVVQGSQARSVGKPLALVDLGEEIRLYIFILFLYACFVKCLKYANFVTNLKIITKNRKKELFNIFIIKH